MELKRRVYVTKKMLIKTSSDFKPDIQEVFTDENANDSDCYHCRHAH